MKKAKNEAVKEELKSLKSHKSSIQ